MTREHPIIGLNFIRAHAFTGRLANDDRQSSGRPAGRQSHQIALARRLHATRFIGDNALATGNPGEQEQRARSL